MTTNTKSRLLFLVATLQLAIGSTTAAQSIPATETKALEAPLLIAEAATVPSPTPAPAVALHADRPTVMVMNFESGTIASKVRDKHGFSRIISAIRRREDATDTFDPAQLGAGIADMLVEKLLETGQFRIVERKALETLTTEQGIKSGAGSVAITAPTAADPALGGSMIGASYMITGSVTKFGFEENNVGGFAARMATGGLFGYKKHKTEVSVTARVVNTATGEIVASMTGEGESGKGGGFVIGGIFRGGAGGVSTSASNFRESAIGEATERAVQNLTERLVARKTSF